MQESWVPLQCVECGEAWELSPEDLPRPSNDFECRNCDTQRPVAEFIKTEQGLKILKEFYQS